MTGANQELSLHSYVTQDQSATRQISQISDSNIAQVQLSFLKTDFTKVKDYPWPDEITNKTFGICYFLLSVVVHLT